MQYRTTSQSIVISLPMTTPTGKVRVKRPLEGFAAEPVACRSVPIEIDDYLEWQINYNTDNLHEPSIVKDVILQKDTGTKYGCELVRLIVEGMRLRLISSGQINDLKKVMNEADELIEETERIEREPASSTKLSERFGFVRHYLKVPNYLKKSEKFTVEIKIAHKQKAVGNQAMIYLCLPIRFCRSQIENSIVGRIANRNELIDYEVNRSNAKLIYDTTLAFIIASNNYREDLRLIFGAMTL